MEDLLEMLRAKRPHDSRTERRWVERWIDPLGAKSDAFGNRFVPIGTAPVLWSSHVDTVHRKGGLQGVRLDGGIVKLRKPGKHGCLGADDAAGVWLMREMINRKVEGLYVFHRGEEYGGLGSRHIAEQHAEVLQGINYAIALDRAGYQDVITHQAGGRCASDDFAFALASELGMKHAPSDGGTFTDTAHYTDVIPECTNLSVGYFDQHTPEETLDVSYLQDLLEALCALDTGKLPVVRDPLEVELEAVHNYGYPKYTPGELEDLVINHPDVAAELLSDYGVTEDEFFQAVYDATGGRVICTH